MRARLRVIPSLVAMVVSLQRGAAEEWQPALRRAQAEIEGDPTVR